MDLQINFEPEKYMIIATSRTSGLRGILCMTSTEDAIQGCSRYTEGCFVISGASVYSVNVENDMTHRTIQTFSKKEYAESFLRFNYIKGIFKKFKGIKVVKMKQVFCCKYRAHHNENGDYTLISKEIFFKDASVGNFIFKTEKAARSYIKKESERLIKIHQNIIKNIDKVKIKENYYL